LSHCGTGERPGELQEDPGAQPGPDLRRIRVARRRDPPPRMSRSRCPAGGRRRRRAAGRYPAGGSRRAALLLLLVSDSSLRPAEQQARHCPMVAGACNSPCSGTAACGPWAVYSRAAQVRSGCSLRLSLASEGLGPLAPVGMRADLISHVFDVGDFPSPSHSSRLSSLARSVTEACAWQMRSCCTPRNFRRPCIRSRYLESGEKS
jgi:hypothetical protein